MFLQNQKTVKKKWVLKHFGFFVKQAH